MKQYSKEEIEADEGKYDKDGFYILTSGEFYDMDGIYFDLDGFDGSGGYYDDYGTYIPPPENYE